MVSSNAFHDSSLLHGKKTIPISSTPSAQYLKSAHSRIVNFMGHAFQMLGQLESQNRAIGFIEEKIKEIYQNTRTKIEQIEKDLHKEIDQPGPERLKKRGELQNRLKAAQKELKNNNLTFAKFNGITEDGSNRTGRKHEKNQNQLHECEIKVKKSQQKVDSLIKELEMNEINNLKEHLTFAEDKIATVIRDSQIEVIKELSEFYAPGSGSEAEILAKGGLKAMWIRFIATVYKTKQVALQAFNASREAMEKASRVMLMAKTDDQSQTEIEKGKQAEFQNYQGAHGDLNRRAGVIGLNGIFRFQALFSKKKIQKQFKSFQAQDISQKDRKTIDDRLKTEGRFFDLKFIPLNKDFDLYVSARGTLSAVFASIFGTKGISSANRQEPHLVNGWESNLIYQGKNIFRALRHAIASDKYEKDPAIRAKNSKQAAEELIKAALLQEISSQGLTLEEARDKKGIELNMNSVSLVTPDDLRALIPGQNDEKMMLLDQLLAFESVQKEGTPIELDGIEIPVKIHVNAFNFGVNLLATKYKLGLENQHQQNTKALKGLRDQIQKFNHEIEKEIALLNDQQKLAKVKKNKNKFPAIKGKITDLRKALENSKALMTDIEDLMANKKAYLQGDNQYELGAKILNLSNVMDQTIDSINKGKKPKEQLSGFKCAFNCMSGKDRTGFMDVVAKSFAIMAEVNGKYPLHQELLKNAKLRDQLVRILQTVILEKGNLEITEINTDIKGFKLGNEARILGLPIETFLTARGLSATTST